MADVKFPNIAQNNNNSFVAPANRNNLEEYNDSAPARNDNRSQSFNSGRGGTGNGFGSKSVVNAKKQRKE